MRPSLLHDYIEPEDQPLDESLIRETPVVDVDPPILLDQGTWTLKWRVKDGVLRIVLLDDPPVSQPGELLGIYYAGRGYLGNAVRTFEDGTIGLDVVLATDPA